MLSLTERCDFLDENISENKYRLRIFRAVWLQLRNFSHGFLRDIGFLYLGFHGRFYVIFGRGQVTCHIIIQTYTKFRELFPFDRKPGGKLMPSVFYEQMLTGCERFHHIESLHASCRALAKPILSRSCVK